MSPAAAGSSGSAVLRYDREAGCTCVSLCCRRHDTLPSSWISIMNSGEINARLYSSGEPVRVRWWEGRISELVPLAPPDVSNLWVAPALVDLQINGFAGIDFQTDGLTEANLL